MSVLDWRERAACRDEDTSVFFPTRGEEYRAALALCNACPVRAECLEFALRNRIGHGIWGGVPERERRRMRVRMDVTGRIELETARCAHCGTAYEVWRGPGRPRRYCSAPCANAQWRQRRAERAEEVA